MTTGTFLHIRLILPLYDASLPTMKKMFKAIIRAVNRLVVSVFPVRFKEFLKSTSFGTRFKAYLNR